LEVLHSLRRGESANLPRFDKSAQGGSGDRCDPEFVASADVVLFEGWFVGARPIDSARFEAAPWPIVTEFDRAFARDCNHRLQAYLPLWEFLDSLLVLAPIDFRFSLTWRQQAEQQMKANGRSGMSDAEIIEFVQYFWRSLHPDLFIQPLLQSEADWAIALDAAHQPASISRPRSATVSLNPERKR
jgi:D-glycerate 3-kinase